MFNYFFPVYSALWKLAAPLLRRSPRLGQYWKQRTLQQAPQGPFDIWIQAASGGEAALINMVLDQLSKIEQSGTQHHQHPLRILATATTPQGIEILKRDGYEKKTNNLTISAFPLDEPAIMEKSFQLFSPRLAILVETELWPAFLACAKKRGVPVLVINGRMSPGSYRNYRVIASFFRNFGPQKVLAMSQQDAKRFGNLLGEERVTTIPNLKFDKITTHPKRKATITSVLPDNSLFIIFGSIRKEEETQVINCIYQLLHQHPQLIIGFFPKHIERATKVMQKITALKIPATLRSSLNQKKAPAGTVIVWDCFGELADAYHQAEAAFVGGSLCPRGGHNLIEPLVAGLRPITGPYWQDFAWIGTRARQLGLIEEVQNSRELTEVLLKRIAHREDKKKNLLFTEKYLESKRGGTVATCNEILHFFAKTTFLKKTHL